MCSVDLMRHDGWCVSDGGGKGECRYMHTRNYAYTYARIHVPAEPMEEDACTQEDTDITQRLAYTHVPAEPMEEERWGRTAWMESSWFMSRKSVTVVSVCVYHNYVCVCVWDGPPCMHSGNLATCYAAGTAGPNRERGRYRSVGTYGGRRGPACSSSPLGTPAPVCGGVCACMRGWAV